MEINKNNIDSFITDNEKAIIYFWAEWCAPCKKFSPIMDEVCSENNISLGKVNIDIEKEISEQYGIRSVPSIALFNKSEPVELITGARPKHIILKDIKKWL